MQKQYITYIFIVLVYKDKISLIKILEVYKVLDRLHRILFYIDS